MMKEVTTTPSMLGRAGPTPNLVSWAPQEGQLPMRQAITGNRVGGLVALVLGVPWFYRTCGLLVDAVARDGFVPGQAFLFALVAGGLAVTLFGLSQFVFREETVIDSDAVRYMRYGLTGFRKWREPLTGYRGVMKSAQYWASSDPEPSRMEFRLTLLHDDASRSVLLYESKNLAGTPGADWDRLWKHYANLFRLPVIDDAETGRETHAVEDIARPLIDKVAEGKVQVPQIDLTGARRTRGCTLHREDDLWVITLRPSDHIWRVVLMFAIGAAALGAAMHFSLSPLDQPPLPIALGAAVLMLAAGVLYGVLVARKLRHPDQIGVDAHNVWFRTWSPRGRDTKNIRITDILGVAVRSTPQYSGGRKRVVVTARQDVVETGASMSERELRQLRDTLLFLICTPAGRKMPPGT